jgi:signal transduction histidine kinase/peroxiredoxin
MTPPMLDLQTRGRNAISERYDLRRRLRALRILLPLTASILTLAALIYTVTIFFHPISITPDWISYVAVSALACLSWFGVIALWRGWLRLATGLIVAIGGIGFPTLVVARGVTRGLDPIGLVELMLFGVTLVFVGMLGSRRTIIGVTLALTVLTAGLFLFAVPQRGLEASWADLQFILLAIALVFEWLFAAFILAQWGTYQQAIRDLGTAVEQAQEVEKLKDQFITHVNHELRTPIMTLDGYVELLHAGRTRMSEQEQEEALAQASRAGKALVTLLESILEVRRIDETAVFDPQIVDIAEALDMAQALLDPRAGGLAGRDLHIDLPRGVAVWGEQVRVQQILTNLLSNAIKYSPPGSPLVVQARTIAASPTPARFDARRAVDARQLVELRVRDFGQGIPPDQASLLFHRFTRLPRDLGSKTPGNGLGLYLCRVFAEAMGGSIHVESTGLPGEGSVFVLRLPDARPDLDVSTEGTHASQATPTVVSEQRLYVGQSARHFVASDLQGRRIDLADYRGRHVFLAFLRFAGCPFCGLRAHTLTLRYPTFQAMGLDVIVVIESARSHAIEQAVLCDAPFPIIADPTGALYRLYETAASQRGLQFALRHRKEEFAEAQRLGLEALVNDGPAYGDGVLDRLPAEFLIDPDQRIGIAHYGKDIGDFLPLETLERHLQQAVDTTSAQTRG